MQLHGIDAIAKHFNLNGMDFLTWHRSMTDPPPMWKENAVWCCDVKAMSDWLKKHKLMPKKLGFFEMIQEKRNLKNAKRQRKNAENWNRTINRHQSRDWKLTDDKLKRGRMW